ncbi:hypothetical protein CAPTEDRAFT_217807 [Capitella teleta]|uniref:LRRCT domain-containing protein n=1 Tax=Capitella teleta TaxID=283909 RepID=R7TN66_CAPTE|nr:hypothetical protein CAPTEDRAFT_217807 [Capitella teleta]|eukprot:ELT94972.1 hypothetical protein CAPTEDRAFT_217807 [Capitella teleta]
MNSQHLLWLLICSLNFENSFGLRVNVKNVGLTSVPSVIDPTVSTFLASGNLISTIHKSDFNDIYPNLSFIELSDNEIVIIESGCFRGTVLRRIELQSNQLTAFPDLSEVKDTIEIIRLQNNKITQISREEIAHLTNVTIINLSNNPLVQLPEFTRFFAFLTELYIKDIDLKCDSSTIWLKRIPDTLNLLLDNEPCSYPAEWRLIPWVNITEDALLQQTIDHETQNNVPNQWKYIILLGYYMIHQETHRKITPFCLELIDSAAYPVDSSMAMAREAHTVQLHHVISLDHTG